MVERLNSIFEAEDSLLGISKETLLSRRVAANIATLENNAWRLTGQPADPAVYDRVRVNIGTRDTFSLSIIDLLAITHASQHDVLVEGTTGRLVTTNGGTLLVGRTSGNRLMIQAVTYTTTETDFEVTVTGQSSSSGLLDRRLGVIQNPSRLRRWLIAWHTSRPVAPESSRLSLNNAQEVQWSSESGDAYEWQAPHIAPDSVANKERYATPIDIYWSHESATWEMEVPGLVYDFHVLYDGGFSESEFGPYQLTDGDWDDAWMRVRDPDTSSWIITQIRESIPRAPALPIRSSGVFNEIFISGDVYKTSFVSIDWRYVRNLIFKLEQYPATGERTAATLERQQTVSMYAEDVFAADINNGDSFQSNSLWFALGEVASSCGRGPINISGYAQSSMAIFRINLLHHFIGGAVGDRRAGSYTIRRWNSSKQWALSMRLL